MLKHKLKGLILAAGKGTRLMPLTEHTPKPLLELNGKPVIHYCIMKLIETGIREIGIVINGEHLHQYVNYLRDVDKDLYKGAMFTYIFQDEQKGVAHAIGMAKKFIGKNRFITILGDNIIEEKLTHLTLMDRMDSTHCILTLKEVSNPSDYGIAEVKHDEVIRVEEKPKTPKSKNAIMGVYAFSPKIFDAIENIQPSSRGEYEITDAIQWLINRDIIVLFNKTDSEYFDVGTVKRFKEAEKYLKLNK